MNFIGVLAVIAGLGFAVSAVQFVRIGVSYVFVVDLIMLMLVHDRSNCIPSSFEL